MKLTTPAERYAAAALVAVLAAAPLLTQHLAAQAPTDLLFSEYIEGTSNNKALEIYNPTGSAIDLAAGGYQVRMYFNGAATAGTTVSLSGTVAAGGVFVLAQASANATILAAANQTSSASWYNGDDAVALYKGTTLVDVIGQVGFDPGTEWGTGLASTADNTLRRKSTVCSGDTNGADVFDPAAQWDGFATDTFGGLGAHSATCAGGDTAAPFVASSNPTAGGDIATAANLTVTFSEPVTVGASWFTLVCSGIPKAATTTGGPVTFTINPVTDFTNGENCTLTVLASQVADVDALDPPDNMTADFAVTFTARDVCALAFTPIYAVQGSGTATPIPGPTTTQGVVVGDYEVPTGANQLRGFYLQDPAGDGNPNTSDGIFVFNGNTNSVNVGDLVRVSGTAAEFQGQTQISATSVVACGTGTVSPIDVTLPFADPTAPERFEGMLVRLPQTLFVTEHFQLGRFGQVVVSSGGVLRQPTNVQKPGPAAGALQTANDLNQLIIDDDNNLQNADPILLGRNGQPLSASNTLRGGDTATGIVGVLGYGWAGDNASPNAYRVRPFGALGGTAVFQPANPRPLAAAPTTASLRVAGMNLLNYFNTFGATACRFGVGGPVAECRGADTAAEFDRQWPKTMKAIIGTHADVVGVIEVENDGYGATSAIQDIVTKLNAATAPGTFAFIDVDAATAQVNALGTDAIKVGLVYKPARVAPIGHTAALNTPAFVNGGDAFPRSRPALAQAFEAIGSGERFAVVVNHFKSKGSECDTPDAGDGQGNCNVVRVRAATELAAWLAADPTGIGDPDVLILGDLNAYAKEDPVGVLEDAG
ncbi:MAG: ExeM/NucH family extracellular endonuclease, partial [Verrucomicrobiota bacterium]